MNKFIVYAMRDFGYTAAEATTIYLVYLKLKAMSVDIHCTGGFRLQHGALWDKEIMDRALEIAPSRL